MQVMTSQLMLDKPANPKKYLIDLLATIQSQGVKPLLETGDIETMFSMFDIMQKGVLTKQQAFRAIKTVLGPQHALVRASAADSEDVVSLLTKDQFVTYVSDALQKSASQVSK